MGIVEILILAVGLAMDAFAVAICKGLALAKTKISHYVTVGAWFGGFQGLMPLVGYFLGKAFGKYIEQIDHWVAFGLLLLIGGNMVKEAFSKEEEYCDNGLGFMTMLVLAVSTSIDAAATGIVLESEGANIWLAVSVIAAVTFMISAVGVKIGNVFGVKYKNKAELAGGIILILLGAKMLLDGLGVINV